MKRLLAAIGLAGMAGVATADPVFTTTHGIEFSTISDIGNPVVPQSVGPVLYLGNPPTLIGSVSYEYRMARTEVTVEQWAEFITAYRPHYTAGNPNNLPFTGTRIAWSQSQQQYVYDPAHARVAADPSWRVAAAYTNWLYNNKAIEAWAFRSGAYDISTFTTNPDGTVNDQPTHSPGARFWIPTLNEWTKAMYWDPDRYGEDLAGQVVINSLAVSGTWSGSVKYGAAPGTAISHTNGVYTAPSSTWGGGAVGLVPFALHDADCIPENGQMIVSSFSVSMFFYGPVTWDPLEDMPVNVYWRPSGGGSWTLDNEHWDVHNSPGTRAITLLYIDENDPSVIPEDREWMIEPVLSGDNALLCDDLLTGSDVPVDDFVYEFDS